MERLINEMLFKLGLNAQLVTNKLRKWNILEYRQCIQWKLHKEYNYSLSEIGEYFEQDDSTVLNSVRKIEAMKSTDEKIKGILKQLK